MKGRLTSDDRPSRSAGAVLQAHLEQTRGLLAPEDAIGVLLDRSRAFLGLAALYVARGLEEEHTIEFLSADPGASCLTPLVDQAGLGTPLHLPDGRVYGTLRGLRLPQDPVLDERDLTFLAFLGEVIGTDLALLEADADRRRSLSAGVRGMVARGEPTMVLQPVRDLVTDEIIGVEALARFRDATVGPEVWFGRAAEVDLAVEFEVHAVRQALALLDRVPAGAYMAVNVSPRVAGAPELVEALAGLDTSRIVIELTENLPLESSDGRPLEELRATGVRIAVDDTGAGHAGLQRLLRAEPELIKLDRTIVQGVADDPARQAMVKALRDFSRAIGADLVAEGIEDPVDAAALRALGVRGGQGFALGRPDSPDVVLGMGAPA